jgi:hypothetical protein
VFSFGEDYQNPEDNQNSTHIQSRGISLQKEIINFHSVMVLGNFGKTTKILF